MRMIPYEGCGLYVVTPAKNTIIIKVCIKCTSSRLNNYTGCIINLDISIAKQLLHFYTYTTKRILTIKINTHDRIY